MLYDTHVHSTISTDASDTAEAVAKAALAKGLTGICFTDHLDLFDPKVIGQKREGSYLAWQKSYQAVANARACVGDKLEILHGMELAEIHMDPVRAKDIVKASPVDFVLGSLHMIAGHVDFCWMAYPNIDFCKDIMSLYLDEILQLANLDLADSIAHIGYPLRYMVRHGFHVDIMDYQEQLRAIFTTMAQKGVGMEINTSGLRQGAGCTFPSLSALALYKACGGEVVTIGSDSHTAQDVGSHLTEAKEMLEAVGFKYYTVFKARKPIYVTV